MIGASRAEQLEENVQALNNLTFSTEELAQIDQHIADGELNLWQASSDNDLLITGARTAPESDQ